MSRDWSLLILLCACLSTSSPARVSGSSETSIKPDMQHALAGADALRSGMKDPDSFVVSRVTFSTNKEDEGYCYEFRARNSYGGRQPSVAEYWYRHKKNGDVKLQLTFQDELAPFQRTGHCSSSTDITADFKAAQPAESTSTQHEQGIVNVMSNPDGADVSVDGAFVGNAPATLKLKPGSHTISVKIPGYADWTRDINIMEGANTKLNATLTKQ